MSNSVTITSADDALNEGDETVIVDITGVTNGTEAVPQQQTVTITDDDGSSERDPVRRRNDSREWRNCDDYSDLVSHFRSAGNGEPGIYRNCDRSGGLFYNRQFNTHTSRKLE